MLKRVIHYFRVNGYTVSEELEKQGFMCHEDLIADIAYNKENISKLWCVVYIVTVIPLVFIMKRSKRFTDLVARIAWKIWIKKSVTKGYDLLKDRAHKRVRPDREFKKRSGRKQ